MDRFVGVPCPEQFLVASVRDFSVEKQEGRGPDEGKDAGPRFGDAEARFSGGDGDAAAEDCGVRGSSVGRRRGSGLAPPQLEDVRLLREWDMGRMTMVDSMEGIAAI